MKILNTVLAIILGVIFLCSLARLADNISNFGKNSAQVDFSVYYTVGQSLKAHFDPYKNGVTLNPPIWDGLARYVNSRYIYPPLTGIPFKLIADNMAYGMAKIFWMYLALACLLASIVIVIRKLKLNLKIWQYMLLGIFTSLFFPLLTYLERGQIDVITLLIALSAISLATNPRPHNVFSGIFWAFATLIKLHIGLVLVFVVLRKQWKILWGYVIGGIIIAVLTVLFLGPGILSNYLFNELPRIIKTGGDRDVPAMKLPDSVFDNYYKTYAPENTSGGLFKDGHYYPGVHLPFAWNASLARFISMRIEDLNSDWKIPSSFFSIILITLLLPAAYFGLKKIKGLNALITPEKEFLYWYAVLMILMLAGPLTWTMNAVWIIPLAALALGRNPWSVDKMDIVPWLLLIFALILAFVPDCMYLGWRNYENPSLFCKALDSSKYIFSEIFIIASIWLQISGVVLFEKIRRPNLPSAEKVDAR